MWEGAYPQTPLSSCELMHAHLDISRSWTPNLESLFHNPRPPSTMYEFVHTKLCYLLFFVITIATETPVNTSLVEFTLCLCFSTVEFDMGTVSLAKL